jgi:hypothetical protein
MTSDRDAERSSRLTREAITRRTGISDGHLPPSIARAAVTQRFRPNAVARRLKVTQITLRASLLRSHGAALKFAYCSRFGLAHVPPLIPEDP